VLQPTLLAPKEPQRRLPYLRLAVALATTLLSACGTWIQDNIPDGDLGGTVSVYWTEIRQVHKGVSFIVAKLGADWQITDPTRCCAAGRNRHGADIILTI
jgi:hypothetical protein